MDQPVKFTAAGRKGELADHLDASGLFAGDHIIIDLGVGTVKITRLDELEFRIEAGTSYGEAAAGETYGAISVTMGTGGAGGSVRFGRKRSPKSDLETASKGEFTS